MEDRLFIADYFSQYYDELTAKEFYREIFPQGQLAEKGQQITGKYNALAVELLPVESENGEKKRNNARKYIITDDLQVIDEIVKSDNFTIISPISYAGKSRKAENARFIYALAIDLDGITAQGHINELMHQINTIEYIPKPTYIVWSGTGLHLYYQFKEAIPCFKNIVKQLAALKNELTKKIWNNVVSELADKPQIESLFQGFRMVGTITKGGNRVRAFVTGEKVDIEYLNKFVEKNKMLEYAYKSNLTLKEAAAKYPEWYQKRIIEKQPKGAWTANRAVYDWWLRELKSKILVGHRYYGVMVLAIYAKKCGIDRNELEQDAFELVNLLDGMTYEESNHFTREDVLAALEMFNDNYITFPIDSISELTAIPIEKNKRNGRKQPIHLEYARGIRAIKAKIGENVSGGGRPKGSRNKINNNKDTILKWKKENPHSSVKECAAATGISQATIYRYWKEGDTNEL